MHFMKLAALCILSTCVGIAQSISPPIAEYRGNDAGGMFEIQNDTESAMAVMLTTKSFIVDEQGHVQYRPLDKDVKVKTGASSFILRPHDSRMIFYKASFPVAPTSFSILATMTKVEVTEGLRIDMVFPHMVYVYQKEKLNKADITVQLSGGVLRIHNSSQKLGRVDGVQASKEDLGGFPLYPNQTREVATLATKATVKFEDGFKVDAQ